MEFFKDAASGSTEHTYVVIRKFNECHNLPDDYDQKVSAVRWANTTAYDHFCWVVGFSGLDCSGDAKFLGYADTPKTFPEDMATLGFKNQLRSVHMGYTHY